MHNTLLGTALAFLLVIVKTRPLDRVGTRGCRRRQGGKLVKSLFGWAANTCTQFTYTQQLVLMQLTTLYGGFQYLTH